MPSLGTLPFTQAAALSRTGHGEAHDNDDRFVLLDARHEGVRAARRGTIFAVADGVGSTQAGEEAAEVTCEALGRFFTIDRSASEDLLRDLIESADAEVRLTTSGACTLSGIWLAEGRVRVFNLGDSAVYRVRGPNMERLTVPQTRGRGLSAFVGMGSAVKHNLVIEREDLQVGDLFLVLSDGVLEAMSEEVLRRAFIRGNTVAHVIGALDRELSNQVHKDDATLIAVHVLGLEAREHELRSMVVG